MANGFLYLCAIIDWFSRYILSWRLSNTLLADFCVDALEEALSRFSGAVSLTLACDYLRVQPKKQSDSGLEAQVTISLITIMRK